MAARSMAAWKPSCIAAAEKASDLELAGLPPQFVSFLNLSNQLELGEGGVEITAERAYPTGGGCR